MELGPHQLQIFVSLVAILGAAFGVLIGHPFKKNNEPPRELTIELKSRRREERWRAIPMRPRPLESASGAGNIEAVHATGVTPFSEAVARTPVETVSAGMAQEEPKMAAALDMAAAPARPRTNWNELLARASLARRSGESSPAQAVALEARRDVLDATSIEMSLRAPEVSIPSGFHDGYVLSRLVRSRKPVSGLVVSIGVSAAEADGEHDPQAVRDLIQSLIGPHDFACASAAGEYLLIFPRERGASAQRRLGTIAQHLWDFQLQAVGAASILFSWGGLEVCGESIEEAVAAASERMRETRRRRALFAFESAALKKAV
jgi:hypothetical protein